MGADDGRGTLAAARLVIEDFRPGANDGDVLRAATLAAAGVELKRWATVYRRALAIAGVRVQSSRGEAEEAFTLAAAEVRVPFPVGATVELRRAHAVARALILHVRGWAGLTFATTHADAFVKELAVGTGGDLTAITAAPDPGVDDALGDFIDGSGGVENGEIVNVFLVR